MPYTFDDVDYFGPFAVVHHEPVKNDIALNVYPGVNGVEAINLGSRGGYVNVKGTFIGAPGDVATAEQNLRNLLRNAVVATFHDDLLDVDHHHCYLESFAVDPEIHQGADGFCRDYQAVFRQLD